MNETPDLKSVERRRQTAAILTVLNTCGDDHGWTETSRIDTEHTLMHQSGYGVHLHYTTRGANFRVAVTTIEVTGVWPVDSTGQRVLPYKDRPSINVSAKRTIAAIAREITNRFLPLYLPLWHEQCKVVASRDAYEAQTQATKSALLALPGISTVRHGSGVYLTGYAPHTITPQGDSVRFEAFSVPADIALKILPLLREVRE